MFRTQRTPKNIDALKASINQNGIFIRRVAVDLGMKKDSVHRILKKDLGFHSYKLQMLQELEEDDTEKGVVVAKEQLEHMKHDQNLFEAMH
uniref:DNA binding HTH domain-containing protein n=1 Tax=Acrobeloides nanus TaxID=290746 RepID=A0A914BYW2_9BILA